MFAERGAASDQKTHYIENKYLKSIKVKISVFLKVRINFDDLNLTLIVYLTIFSEI